MENYAIDRERRGLTPPHVGSPTIVAISSAPGRGGIGIVRVAGPAAPAIVKSISGQIPAPRVAVYAAFRDHNGESIDEGIVIHYPGPRSYTGDDVVEFHAHGNPLVLQQIVATACRLGARPARPGEFTERAFLNGKLDLAQAEAVADLIDSQTVRAARSAQRTLRGDFARAVNAVIDGIHAARAALEASIDFADDVVADDLLGRQQGTVAALVSDLTDIVARASRGARLRSGANLAIVGAPNVGKSSLLNALSGDDRAIVSDIPGTTRDIVDADIAINDIPIRLVDTAGLRSAADPIEREGIARAHRALASADLALIVTDRVDIVDEAALWRTLGCEPIAGLARIIVHNKIDRHGRASGRERHNDLDHVFVSALTGDGLEELRSEIVCMLGVAEDGETEFTARARHLDALHCALEELQHIDGERLNVNPELAAEHYRAASIALEAIGGRFSDEDLLGEIFSKFCIGK